MEIFVVNAFAENGFAGNPAGVCFVDRFPRDSEMKKIAAEAGFSETAFVRKRRDRFFIRWWTPQAEVPLCGHATLAAAHAIWLGGHGGKIFFVSTGYELIAENKSGIIEMDFPVVREKKCDLPANIPDGLGTEEIVYSGKNPFDYLIELKSEDDVTGIRPDFEKLAVTDCRGIIVTSASGGGGYDFVSRFFAPRVGIDEDPVTGSAHCCLAPYWAGKTGSKTLTGFQASKRGGIVHTEVLGERVKIGGRAVAGGVLRLGV